MIIKLTGVEDGKLGSKAAKVIMGEKVGTGEKWATKFFANNKEIRDKLSDMEMGDIINVVFTKNGEFYNVSDVLEATDEDIEKAEKYGKKQSGGSSAGSNPAIRRSDGGSRGDDTNRSAAIYLARDVVAATQDGKKFTSAEYALLCVNLADTIIYPYIKDGAVYTPSKEEMKKPAGRPKKDPLDPPEVED